MPHHRRSDSDSGYTFNPVQALVEDAVTDSSELFTDFLDNLLVQVPPELGAPRVLGVPHPFPCA